MPRIALLYIALATTTLPAFARAPLQVDQDYAAARALATEHDKLLFVDFYTTWCKPCKQLDAAVFEDSAHAARLAEDYVLLKYDTERDNVHHLSKKHHVNGYPTGLVLNRDGYVVARTFGYGGGDTDEEMVAASWSFADAAADSARVGVYVPGYAPNIAPGAYPNFYTDFVERTNTNVDTSAAFAAYFRDAPGRLGEVYFSVLYYFGFEVGDGVADRFLEDAPRYRELYGETDVNSVAEFMSYKRLVDAVETRDAGRFGAAAVFAKAALPPERSAELIGRFRAKLAEATVEE